MAERISRHAKERAAQRNISQEDMDFVLRYGQEIHRSGAVFIFLGHKDIPTNLVRKRRVEKLVGTTLLISSDCDQIITAYRNRNALRDIKRKAKRYMPKSSSAWN